MEALDKNLIPKLRSAQGDLLAVFGSLPAFAVEPCKKAIAALEDAAHAFEDAQEAITGLTFENIRCAARAGIIRDISITEERLRAHDNLEEADSERASLRAALFAARLRLEELEETHKEELCYVSMSRDEAAQARIAELEAQVAAARVAGEKLKDSLVEYDCSCVCSCGNAPECHCAPDPECPQHGIDTWFG